ncbi:MAG: helix-turn-helix transcriptional regulator [Cyanothece sp. SIO1E1]|nr:helix-turn-helix transcriptional regulator [Cyanothece sp. SIO1E1]
MNTCIEKTKTSTIPAAQLGSPIASSKFTLATQQDKTFWYTEQQSAPLSLLQAVLEGLIDGILILTSQGDLIHANNCAHQICKKLYPSSQNWHQGCLIPEKIWQICQSFASSRGLFPDQSVVLEDEIGTEKSTVIRVRVQWIDLRTIDSPCLMVTLEDRYQAAQKLALAETERYGLTPRESEVWLLRRINYTYEEIAAELYIAMNTVKKHMKSILAKRQAVLGT